MRHPTQFSRAARAWRSLIGLRWERWQCRVSGLYFHRVTEPLQWYHAVGCSPEFAPRLPWWQPIVWRYLVLTGWQPHRPSRRYRV